MHKEMTAPYDAAMKKSAAGTKHASEASEDGVKAVQAYLAKVPEPARGTLEKLRAMIRAAAPREATEGLSYGMPAFTYGKPLVGYAAFKDHCSLFPMSGAVIAAMNDELKGYVTSKGTIQFALEKPLPASLVKKIVKARLAEIDSKSKR
jgi:uncharacterized protein YdhG (YjbR/CyaY superfamily)